MMPGRQDTGSDFGGGNKESPVVLSVSGLTFAYGQIGAEGSSDSWLLSNLSLTVHEGEIVCILGASGCGKSTLLNLIAGLLLPHKGAIALSGGSTASKRTAYIFQEDALFPWRTVEANLMLANDLKPGISRSESLKLIAQYLNTFHLSEDILHQYPLQLSGGMRQRVSIIQSLMFDPDLLLLDEPFSALDFYTKLKLESEFYQLVKDRRKAAILVTHDIEEAIAMGDRVLIMDGSGRFSHEFFIDLEDAGMDRLPENARGTPRFAGFYRAIWSDLKAVITA